ncbi:hypothetical protein D3C76_1747660 [compost metagenome]
MRAATAQGFGHGQRNQVVLMQQLEVVMGEGAALVINMGSAAQLFADAFKQGIEIGYFDRAQHGRVLGRKTHGDFTRSKRVRDSS